MRNPLFNERKKAMTTILYAQPYDISAEGFYFRDAEEYTTNAAALRNSYGQHVEEFEIQFIDGDALTFELTRAVGINQANFSHVLKCAEEWDEHETIAVIIAVGECGYDFRDSTAPDDFEVDIYRVDSMRDLAEQFVDDGLFGDIPEHLANYIDFDAIARDLACDYSEAVIGGERLIYRCG